jgi:ribosomal protein S18 acetylase RimI-like enzyme
MTATVSRERDRARSHYTIERLSDPTAIRRILLPERAYAAYALAQLEPSLFRIAEWYLSSGPDGAALLLHSRGGLGRALFALGQPEALDAALGLHPGPRFSFGSLRPEHRGAIQKYFLFTRPHTMLRMSVSTENFAPADGQAVHLTGRDIGAINRLYAAESGSSAYQPRHIDEGVYFGVQVDGNLVAIAGTHVVSYSEGVAVVGNVFTHPLYRGGGLAKIATSATTKALLERCPLVVLTVENENEPAVRVYRRLGYETQCTLHETPLIRKEPIGTLSFFRRMFASRRGKAEGKEIVIR